MSYRSCGACTACCEGWLHSDVPDMGPGRPCEHCTRQGCAIYPDRPQDPCVNFLCAWMQPNGRLPKRMRPDRAGAIVVLGRKWPPPEEVIYAWPVGPAIPQETLKWLEDYARRENKPLITIEHQLDAGKFTGMTATGFGPPAFIELVKSKLRPEEIIAM